MIKYSVKKPFTVLVAVIVVLAIGFVCLTGMKTDLLPDMSMPYMIVVTTYPGASPEKVEESVTKPMESALGTINGVEEVTSTSAENYSMVMLEFEEDTSMDSAMVKVSSATNQIESLLPDTCGKPNIMEISMDMMATMYASVSCEGMDIYELSDFAQDTVIPYFERQGGVASVSDIGIVEKSIEVRLNQEKIDQINEKILLLTNDKLSDAKNELADAESSLAEARSEINKREQDLSSQQDTTTTELADATLALNQAVHKGFLRIAAYQPKSQQIRPGRRKKGLQKEQNRKYIQQLKRNVCTAAGSRGRNAGAAWGIQPAGRGADARGREGRHGSSQEAFLF